MHFLFKKGYHLVRYFLLFALLAFGAYRFSDGNPLLLTIMGPPIYLAYHFKNFLITYLALGPVLETLPVDPANDFIFLLPITFIYFGVIGFQIKQIQKEQGLIRHITTLALLGFIGYVHYKAWDYLHAFFATNL